MVRKYYNMMIYDLIIIYHLSDRGAINIDIIRI